MEGFLLLGFLIGMAHALEADHLAAISVIALTQKGSRRSLAARGAAWGLGHTTTLFLICSVVLLFGVTLTEQTAAALELAVGVMLILLGLQVAIMMRKKRVHFHAHDHGDGQRHLHAHSHAGETAPHDESRHDHRHRARFPLKAMALGLVHGAAGSAGLLALAVAATQNAWLAVGYVLLFGVGSILGMTVLTFIAAWPIKAAEQRAGALHRTLQVLAAGWAVVMGGLLIGETAPVALAGLI